MFHLVMSQEYQAGNFVTERDNLKGIATKFNLQNIV